MAVSKRLRYEILTRDANTCRYCNATDTPLTIDHVVPVALGGTDDPRNLVAACRDCNAGKSASNPDAPLVAQVDDDAMRWAAAIKQAAATQLADLKALQRYTKAVYKMWAAGSDHTGYLPADWPASVERWYSMGVDLAEIQYAVDAARGAQRVRLWDMWKYACGVIYKRLNAQQEMARKLLNSEELTATEVDEDHVLMLEHDRGLHTDFLVVACMWPEIAELEKAILAKVGEVCNGSDFEPYDIWIGGPEFEAEYGDGVERMVAEALKPSWIEDSERSRVSGYCARLVSLAHEAIESSYAASMQEASQ